MKYKVTLNFKVPSKGISFMRPISYWLADFYEKHDAEQFARIKQVELSDINSIGITEFSVTVEELAF